MEPKPRKLLDQMRDAIRLKNYAYSTEKAYVDWVERYIRFHKLRHPREMNTPEIEAFLTHLAVAKNVSPSTQNQALCAILFLYRHVLHIFSATVLLRICLKPVTRAPSGRARCKNCSATRMAKLLKSTPTCSTKVRLGCAARSIDLGYILALADFSCAGWRIYRTRYASLLQIRA
jgi:Phage integrase, N-terminal SAM-like domain